MTDDRIAELLGWPRGRANRDSSLMHRIRIIVAEAQAEQDGHIYRLREQIARDTAQIERMRAALVEAREIIDVDRRALAECSRRPDGSHEPGDASALADYDRRLALIDAALEDENTLRADELGEQARRIAAMTEALTRAHAQVAMDRELFVRGAAAPGQPLDPDDQEIADEYIALLRMIDEAMGEPS